MGNKAPNEKPKKEHQANQVLTSGVNPGFGGGGGGGTQTALKIRLIKLQLSVLGQTHEGDSVEVQWQGNAYGVFLASQLLGTVPSNYNERLGAPMSHSAVVNELMQQPPSVVIEVAL